MAPPHAHRPSAAAQRGGDPAWHESGVAPRADATRHSAFDCLYAVLSWQTNVTFRLGVTTSCDRASCRLPKKHGPSLTTIAWDGAPPTTMLGAWTWPWQTIVRLPLGVATICPEVRTTLRKIVGFWIRQVVEVTVAPDSAATASAITALSASSKVAGESAISSPTASESVVPAAAPPVAGSTRSALAARAATSATAASTAAPVHRIFIACPLLLVQCAGAAPSGLPWWTASGSIPHESSPTALSFGPGVSPVHSATVPSVPRRWS